jgi:hypothetical protein
VESGGGLTDGRWRSAGPRSVNRHSSIALIPQRFSILLFMAAKIRRGPRPNSAARCRSPSRFSLERGTSSVAETIINLARREFGGDRSGMGRWKRAFDARWRSARQDLAGRDDRRPRGVASQVCASRAIAGGSMRGNLGIRKASQPSSVVG